MAQSHKGGFLRRQPGQQRRAVGIAGVGNIAYEGLQQVVQQRHGEAPRLRAASSSEASIEPGQSAIVMVRTGACSDIGIPSPRINGVAIFRLRRLSVPILHAIA